MARLPTCRSESTDGDVASTALESDLVLVLQPYRGQETPCTPNVRRTHSNAGINGRKHMFEQKKSFKIETCGPCGNR
jgi:hypothetical protein